MEEMVKITKREYDELLRQACFFNALEEHGVDNWCGYDDARKQYVEEWIGEEEE